MKAPIRLAIAAAAGLALGAAVGILYLLAYVVGELYLSGHSLEPAWFERAANLLFGLVLLLAGGIGFAAGWRLTGRSTSASGR
jgi:hypothetical protein